VPNLVENGYVIMRAIADLLAIQYELELDQNFLAVSLGAESVDP